MSATKHQVIPKQAVVLTGCSSGIGHAAVRGLIEAGYFVFGSVRKEADAQRLREAFGSSFEPLLFDVTDEKAVEAAAARVRVRLGGRRLTALINNAGIANVAPLALMGTKDFKKQFDVNVTGTFIVTKAFLQSGLLGTDPSLSGPPGRILMITSTSDSISFPLFGAYSASKHAVRAMADALRREVAMYGIGVVIMSYGATLSSIMGKVEDTMPDMDLENSDYRPLASWLRKFVKDHSNPKNVLSPEASNHWILSVLQAKHPPSRVHPMLFSERVLMAVLGLLSLWTPAIDFVVARVFNLHKLPKRD